MNRLKQCTMYQSLLDSDEPSLIFLENHPRSILIQSTDILIDVDGNYESLCKFFSVIETPKVQDTITEQDFSNLAILFDFFMVDESLRNEISENYLYNFLRISFNNYNGEIVAGRNH